jgi:DNA-binding response OmpR family regulator
MRVMILEDDLNDLHIAADAARAMGITDIEAFMWLAPAQVWLEEAFRGERPLPDAIILDLALGCDSGYELLRAWHRANAQSKIHIIVWSNMESRNQELCDLFNVDAYFNKWEGATALRDALRRFSPAEVN